MDEHEEPHVVWIEHVGAVDCFCEIGQEHDDEGRVLNAGRVDTEPPPFPG